MTPKERLEKKHQEFKNDWIYMNPDNFVRKYYQGKWINR